MPWSRCGLNAVLSATCATMNVALQPDHIRAKARAGRDPRCYWLWSRSPWASDRRCCAWHPRRWVTRWRWPCKYRSRWRCLSASAWSYRPAWTRLTARKTAWRAGWARWAAATTRPTKLPTKCVSLQSGPSSQPTKRRRPWCHLFCSNFVRCVCLFNFLFNSLTMLLLFICLCRLNLSYAAVFVCFVFN